MRAGKKKLGRLGCGGQMCLCLYVNEITCSSVLCTSTAGIANTALDLVFMAELESMNVS